MKNISPDRVNCSEIEKSQENFFKKKRFSFWDLDFSQNLKLNKTMKLSRIEKNHERKKIFRKRKSLSFAEEGKVKTLTFYEGSKKKVKKLISRSRKKKKNSSQSQIVNIEKLKRLIDEEARRDSEQGIKNLKIPNQNENNILKLDLSKVNSVLNKPPKSAEISKNSSRKNILQKNKLKKKSKKKLPEQRVLYSARARYNNKLAIEHTSNERKGLHLKKFKEGHNSVLDYLKSKKLRVESNIKNFIDRSLKKYSKKEKKKNQKNFTSFSSQKNPKISIFQTLEIKKSSSKKKLKLNESYELVEDEDESEKMEMLRIPLKKKMKNIKSELYSEKNSKSISSISSKKETENSSKDSKEDISQKEVKMENMNSHEDMNQFFTSMRGFYQMKKNDSKFPRMNSSRSWTRKSIESRSRSRVQSIPKDDKDIACNTQGKFPSNTKSKKINFFNFF